MLGFPYLTMLGELYEIQVTWRNLHMFDWRKKLKLNDPNDKSMQLDFWNWTNERSVVVDNRESIVCEKCRGRKVLDVGGVAHNKKYAKSPHWMHGKIARVSKCVTGVDILENEINWLNSKGYNFICMDATSDEYLGEKFDVVFMGDLIEHVDNVKGLLLFAKRHLADNGTILISTACPFYYNSVFAFLKKQGPRDNMEHVSWVTPSNMNELCCRTGLEFVRTYYVLGGWGLKHSIRKWIGKGIVPKEYCSYLYIYELKNN